MATGGPTEALDPMPIRHATPARAHLESGFRFVSAATDTVILAQGVRREIERTRGPGA